MTHCFRNVYVWTKTKLVQPYITSSKMMFPIRNDVTIDCEQERCKANTNWCKIVRCVLCVVAFLLFIIIVNSISEEKRTDEIENPGKESPGKCKIEIGDDMKEEIRSWIQKEIQNNPKLCAKSSRISPEQMRNLIKEEIKRQQKIQLKPDFASASAGGMIINASPTWTEGYSYIYFLFIPIRSTAPPPSIILEDPRKTPWLNDLRSNPFTKNFINDCLLLRRPIQSDSDRRVKSQISHFLGIRTPTRQAGDCWPMRGTEGKLLIHLAARANIVGFTMEHIDPAMSLSGGTPEAPNNFSVYGIENIETPEKRHLFGSYSYDNKNEDESQYFRVQNINRKSFLYVELEISSNHGNDKYTCLYRFQVHGYIDRAFHC